MLALDFLGVSFAWAMLFSTGHFFQIPPDLVVKFQPIDIADVILQMILRLRIMYPQEIKG